MNSWCGTNVRDFFSPLVLTGWYITTVFYHFFLMDIKKLINCSEYWLEMALVFSGIEMHTTRWTLFVWVPFHPVKVPFLFQIESNLHIKVFTSLVTWRPGWSAAFSANAKSWHLPTLPSMWTTCRSHWLIISDADKKTSWKGQKMIYYVSCSGLAQCDGSRRAGESSSTGRW